MFRVVQTNGLSDRIEQFILNELRQQAESMVVLRRKDVAEKLECAPSQVTYVVNTRFTPREGFQVESRRGANGFIRIALLQNQPDELGTRETEASEASTGTTQAEVADISEKMDMDFRKLLSSGMVTMRECLLMRNVMYTMLAAVPIERRGFAVNAAFKRILQTLREGK